MGSDTLDNDGPYQTPSTQVTPNCPASPSKNKGIQCELSSINVGQDLFDEMVGSGNRYASPVRKLPSKQDGVKFLKGRITEVLVLSIPSPPANPRNRLIDTLLSSY